MVDLKHRMPSGDNQTPRQLIGTILLSNGTITDNDLLAALDAQQDTGELIGRVLVANGACDKHAIGKALLEQRLIGEIDVGRIALEHEAVAILPADRARRMRAVPFEVLPGMLCVAMVNPMSIKTLDEIQGLTAMHVRVFGASHEQMLIALKRAYDIDDAW